MNERDRDAAGVADLGFGILYQDLEVALLLVSVTDALGIFGELGGVVSFGKQVLEEDGVRDADRPQILHRAAQFADLKRSDIRRACDA